MMSITNERPISLSDETKAMAIVKENSKPETEGIFASIAKSEKTPTALAAAFSGVVILFNLSLFMQIAKIAILFLITVVGGSYLLTKTELAEEDRKKLNAVIFGLACIIFGITLIVKLKNQLKNVLLAGIICAVMLLSYYGLMICYGHDKEYASGKIKKVIGSVKDNGIRVGKVWQSGLDTLKDNKEVYLGNLAEHFGGEVAANLQEGEKGFLQAVKDTGAFIGEAGSETTPGIQVKENKIENEEIETIDN